MKISVFILMFLGLTLSVSAQKRLVLEGHYQGKNLFVQNPFKDGGVGFCADKVTVNGDVTADEINSSAFEIDFKKLGLKQGDPVSVVIEHGGDCTPKVLNKEVLLSTSTCEWVEVTASPEGDISWKTTGESGSLPFVIEVYNWNKWIPVGEVDGIGTSEEHTYEFKINPHSGENKVRIKQVDHTKKARMSRPKTFESGKAEVTFTPKKVSKEIKFDGKTRYEIYDAYGNIVMKGFGESINCEGLKKGAYYLNYDNKNEKFLKK